MAKCPKCNKFIPFYKALTYTHFTGLRCSYCNERAFISKEYMIFYTLQVVGCSVATGVVYIIMSKFINLPNLFLFCLAVVVGVVLFVVIFWARVVLKGE